MDAGVSYLYSLAESQLFQYNKGFGGLLSQSLKTRVPGFATYFNLKYKKQALISPMLLQSPLLH